MPAAKLGKINLLPKDSFEYSVLGKFLKWALTTGRVLVVLTEFVVILAFGSRFYYDMRVNDLIEENKSKQQVVDSYAEIERQMREVLSKQRVVSGFLENNLSIGERITSISRITPADVTYEDLNINESGFSLAGVAGSEGGFANLLIGIKTLPDVENVSIGSVEYDQRAGTISFKIQVGVSQES